MEFYIQVLGPVKSWKDKENILVDTLFMQQITDAILVDLQDFHESVKEEAQLLLLCMMKCFLPPQVLAGEQMELVQILKANLSHGWPKKLNQQLKDAAGMECDMIKYLFSDA